MTGVIVKSALAFSVVLNTYLVVEDVLTRGVSLGTGMSAGAAVVCLVVLMWVLFK